MFLEKTNRSYALLVNGLVKNFSREGFLKWVKESGLADRSWQKNDVVLIDNLEFQFDLEGGFIIHGQYKDLLERELE